MRCLKDCGDSACADRAHELDVMHDESPVSTDDVNAIMEENEGSPMVAELQLEAALAQLGESGEAGVRSGGTGRQRQA